MSRRRDLLLVVVGLIIGILLPSFSLVVDFKVLLAAFGLGLAMAIALFLYAPELKALVERVRDAGERNGVLTARRTVVYADPNDDAVDSEMDAPAFKEDEAGIRKAAAAPCARDDLSPSDEADPFDDNTPEYESRRLRPRQNYTGRSRTGWVVASLFVGIPVLFGALIASLGSNENTTFTSVSSAMGDLALDEAPPEILGGGAFKTPPRVVMEPVAAPIEVYEHVAEAAARPAPAGYPVSADAWAPYGEEAEAAATAATLASLQRETQPEELAKFFTSAPLPAVRNRIEALLDENPTDDMRGLLLAAMFGQKQYEEALELLCKLADNKAAEARFVYNAQASIRGMALEPGIGVRKAAEYARKLKNDCSSNMFSPGWAAVPTPLMESFRVGAPRSSYTFSPSDEDVAFLKRYLATEEANLDPFAPELTYFAGNFSGTISNFPNTRAANLAQIDKAVMGSDGAAQVKALRALFDENLSLLSRFDEFITQERATDLLCKVSIRAGDAASRRLALDLLVARAAIKDDDDDWDERAECMDEFAHAIGDGPPLARDDLRRIATAASSNDSLSRLLGSYLEARIRNAGDKALLADLKSIPTDGLSTNARSAIAEHALPAAASQLRKESVQALVSWLKQGEAEIVQDSLEKAVFIYAARFGAEAGTKLVLENLGDDDALMSPIVASLLEDKIAGPGLASINLESYEWSPKLEAKRVSIAGFARVWKLIDATEIMPGASPRLDNWRDGLRNQIRDRLVKRLDAVASKTDWRSRINGYEDVRKTFTGVLGKYDPTLQLEESLVDGLAKDAKKAVMDWRFADAQQLGKFTLALPEIKDEQRESIEATLAEITVVQAEDCNSLIDRGSKPLDDGSRRTGPLTACLAKKPDLEQKARSLYLIASIQRQNGELKQSLATLQRFLDEIPEHALRDDIMAEQGWTYMNLPTPDRAAAKRIFLKLYELYPEANAADNALWWLGTMATEEKDTISAARYYSIILAMETTERMNSLVKERVAPRQRYKVPELDAVDRWRADATIEAVQPSELPASANPAGLQSGDRVISLCDSTVTDLASLERVKTEIPDDAKSCEMTVDRAGLKVQITVDVEPIVKDPPLTSENAQPASDASIKASATQAGPIFETWIFITGALALVLISFGVGAFFYIRARRRAGF